MQKKVARIVLLLISDLLSFHIALFLAFYTRIFLGRIFGARLIPFRHTLPQYTLLSGLPFVFVFVLAAFGLYHKRRFFWEEFKEFLKAILLFFVSIVTVLSIFKVFGKFSRIVFILTFFNLSFLFPLLRLFANALLRRLGIFENCVFIGSETSKKLFEDEILKNRYLNFRLSESGEYAFLATSTLDFEKQLISLQRKHRYVLVFDDSEKFLPLEFRLYFPMGKGIFLASFENRLLDPVAMFGKRCIDLAVVLLLLPFFILSLAIFGLMIKLESKGPIFYKQKRVGYGGKTFGLLKFRTMYCDADRRLKEILEKDPRAREEWNKYYKLKDDPRVTKIGKFLRKTSLDELPQIINILKGEMSFVGPRPVLQEELEKYYKENAENYLKVRPGLTGLWQVSGRNELDYERRVKLDMVYIHNWSLWLDIVIFLQTFVVVFKGKGAY